MSARVSRFDFGLPNHGLQITIVRIKEARETAEEKALRRKAKKST